MVAFNSPDWLSTYMQQPKQSFTEKYINPIEKAGVAIGSVYNQTTNKAKIDEIIADETKKAEVRKGMTPVEVDAEGNLIPTSGPAKGELDYKSLERRLLPYDKELSAKYGVMAERQAAQDEANELKREQFTAAAKDKLDQEQKDQAPRIQSAMNALRNQQTQVIATFGKDSQAYKDNETLIGYLANELASNTPSLQNAYKRAGFALSTDASGNAIVGTTGLGTSGTQGPVTSAMVDTKNLTSAIPYKPIQDEIKAASEGKVVDGVIDDIDNIRATIRDWAVAELERLGVSSDPKVTSIVNSLNESLNKRAETIAKKYESSEGRRKEAKAESKTAAERKSTFEKDYKAMNLYAREMTDNSEPQMKRAAINVVLRKETGAAIGADEFKNLMSTMLDSQDYAELTSDLANTANYISGMIGGKQPLQESLVTKYTAKVKANRYKDYIEKQTPKEYLDILNKDTKNEPTKKGSFVIKGWN